MKSVAEPAPDPRDAYDALADAYDAFTGGYPHERWLAALEALAIEYGLAGNRLLDVACGTGASFLPMLSRGYRVTGCDISQRMLARAYAKAPDAVLHAADMRHLPAFGRFDLITCLDDPLNYVLDDVDMLAALAGFARNLAPSGLAVWDLNTLAQYRGQFATDRVVVEGDMFVSWNAARTNADTQAGSLVDVKVDVFRRCWGDYWQRSSARHRQRHWSVPEMEALCDRAGLRILDVRGQRPGAIIEARFDELTHVKAIYVACLVGKER